MRIQKALRLCALFLLPLLVRGQHAPTAQPASLTGTVVDVRNDPIPQANIALNGPTSADSASTVANDSGFFAFRNLRPGISYRLTVTAKGFADWSSLPIVLKSGQMLDLTSIRLDIPVVQTTVVALTAEQLATQEVKVAEKQRVLGIFPNFYVVYSPDPVPLTAKLKYRLALRTVLDPVNFAATGLFAALDQSGDTPDYREGARGYAERYAADYADGFTDIMIGGAILPSLFHQDPRYFYQGTGTTKSRLLHAVASPFACKGDNGRNQVNISSIGGDLASGALSNLYYPPSNRGPGLVFEGALITTGARVVDAVLQEFLFRRVTPSAKKQK